jgi:hypothetical protein
MDNHAVHRQMFVGSSIIVAGRERHWQPEAKVRIVAESFSARPTIRKCSDSHKFDFYCSENDLSWSKRL